MLGYTYRQILVPRSSTGLLLMKGHIVQFGCLIQASIKRLPRIIRMSSDICISYWEIWSSNHGNKDPEMQNGNASHILYPRLPCLQKPPELAE